MKKMKYSYSKWIGKVPSHWLIAKVKNYFYRSKEEAHQEDPVVLSLTRSGVKVRDLSKNEGQLAESYFNYNPVKPGDLLLNPMDLYSGANCSVSKVKGVISPAYMNLRNWGTANPVYYDYYFKTQYWSMAFFAHGEGVSFDNRWTLNTEGLFNYPIPVPPLSEQQRIADFLDRKCADIENIIEKTKISIEEYKKYKQSVISEAVTKGIRNQRPKKDSGVAWIGEIPEDYFVSSLGKLFRLQRGYDLSQEQFIMGNYPVCGSNGIIGYHSTMTTAKPCVTIGRSGSVGKVNYYDCDAWVHNTAIYVKDYFGSEPKYIYYVLMSLNMDYMSTKTAVPTLDRKNIQRFQYTYTLDNEEQKEIVSFLDQKCSEIDSLIESKERFIKELETYKKSLIYEFVTGKKEVE